MKSFQLNEIEEDITCLDCKEEPYGCYYGYYNDYPYTKYEKIKNFYFKDKEEPFKNDKLSWNCLFLAIRMDLL